MDVTPRLKDALIISAGGFGRSVYNIMQNDVANGVDWKVIGFLNGMVEVEIDEMGYHKKAHIDIQDIRRLQKNSN